MNNRKLKKNWDVKISDGASSSDDFFSNASLKRLRFPVTSNYSYQSILKEKHEELLEEISLDNTVILDTLLQNEDLTESDMESIRMENGRKDQVRSLLLILHDRGPTVFKHFVTSLKTDYSHLESSLRDELEECEKQSCVMTKCTICRIEMTVHPKDIIDRLYSKGTLSTKEIKSILKCSNEIGWGQLKPILCRNGDARDALVGALAGKFPDLSLEYSNISSNKFACFCKLLRIGQRCYQNIRLSPDYNTTSSNPSVTSSSTSSPASSLKENKRIDQTSGDKDNFCEQFRGGNNQISKEFHEEQEISDENNNSSTKFQNEKIDTSKLEENKIKRNGFNRKAQKRKEV